MSSMAMRVQRRIHTNLCSANRSSIAVSRSFAIGCGTRKKQLRAPLLARNSSNGAIELGLQKRETPGAEDKTDRSRVVEENFEKAIFNCRFFTLFAVVGSLAGSLLCFFKGSTYIVKSFLEYFQHCIGQGAESGKVILLLVEAVDVYLVGTVMLIFGMGLYELFVSTLEVPGGVCSIGVGTTVCGSNLFGLFRLRERPKWLEIRSLDELKTKLGHVIIMVLLVGMFEKSKKIPVTSGVELLQFSVSILMASCCLYLLSKLHSTNH